MNQPYIIDFTQLKLTDIPSVGGKNASLGEMIGNLSSAGVNVPGGFATTAQAFRDFLDFNHLTSRISDALSKLDVADVTQLAATGKEVRSWVAQSPLQPDLEAAIRTACAEQGDVPVAVRSSATAEDLPNASFAGQQETYLNIQGVDNILAAIRLVFASLYNDRAIAYRVHQGFEHDLVALSAGVQRMVRSDLACSGVMFTLDTESGFDGVVFITAAYGLGETVVQGQVNPDEYYVHKPTRAVIRRTLGSKAIKMIFGAGQNAASATQVVDVIAAERQQFALSDKDILALAEQAISIEQHYGRPMDIEWAKDGVTGELFIVQARPETVKARAGTTQTRFALKQHSRILAQGRAIGGRIGQGVVRNIVSPAEMARVQKGDVLVTDMTDPDWEPVMRVASAIVTNRGGRTCHAAIIARELGIPAVVGAEDATTSLADGTEVTVSCAEGDTGFVYEGRLEVEMTEVTLENLGEPPVKIMMNLGNPERAFDACQLPNHGVGLARLEFIINNQIGIHPRAALDYPNVPADVRAILEAKSSGYGDPVNYYVEKLAEGVATLGAAFWPKPVIVRLSDFKSNEYANLPGGRAYEPNEENPMLGLRGAARYVSPLFRDAFALECRAVKKVRETLGLTNVELMVPFVRTVDEAGAVVEALARNGLKRGEKGLRLIMMCEVPSNVILAHDFLEYFDGYSIGSNDLTQLTLGIDRDSSLVAASFDERNPAVKALLSQAISACKQAGKYVGICGQGPSDHPDLADWLVAQGIDSLSLNPDTVLETWQRLGRG